MSYHPRVWISTIVQRSVQPHLPRHHPIDLPMHGSFFSLVLYLPIVSCLTRRCLTFQVTANDLRTGFSEWKLGGPDEMAWFSYSNTVSEWVSLRPRPSKWEIVRRGVVGWEVWYIDRQRRRKDLGFENSLLEWSWRARMGRPECTYGLSGIPKGTEVLQIDDRKL